MYRTRDTSRSRLTTRRATFGAVVASVVLGGAATVAGAAADQPALDDAVAAFGDRVEALGFRSIGPGQPVEPGDDPFGDCTELLGPVSAFAAELPGEAARAISDDYRFDPAAVAASEPNGSGPDESRPDGPAGWDLRAEFTGATVVVVDDGEVAGLGAVVEGIVSDEFVECIDAIAAVDFMTDIDELAAELDDPTVQVSAATDLGVGAASAAISFGVDAADGFAFGAITLAAATEGDALAVVTHVRFFLDAPLSGFDPSAELQEILSQIGQLVRH